VAAVNRIDNLKTGIVRGCGAWGVINGVRPVKCIWKGV
jgi:hypothetical protein